MYFKGYQAKGDADMGSMVLCDGERGNNQKTMFKFYFNGDQFPLMKVKFSNNKSGGKDLSIEFTGETEAHLFNILMGKISERSLCKISDEEMKDLMILNDFLLRFDSLKLLFFY